jgi:hypothetical protein
LFDSGWRDASNESKDACGGISQVGQLFGEHRGPHRRWWREVALTNVSVNYAGQEPSFNRRVGKKSAKRGFASIHIPHDEDSEFALLFDGR